MTAVDLNGATVVGTGASHGFGRATAVALAESGAQVVGVARHRGGLEELQRELGDALNCETGDVADPELPARLFGTYRPTAVVLDAGVTPVIAPLDGAGWYHRGGVHRARRRDRHARPGRQACGRRHGRRVILGAGVPPDIRRAAAARLSQ
jgi:hypothetical protein